MTEFCENARDFLALSARDSFLTNHIPRQTLMWYTDKKGEKSSNMTVNFTYLEGVGRNVI